jgi:hypothetical protein
LGNQRIYSLIEFGTFFLSRNDGKINGEAWELMVTNGEEREEHSVVSSQTKRLGKKRETLEGMKKV